MRRCSVFRYAQECAQLWEALCRRPRAFVIFPRAMLVAARRR